MKIGILRETKLPVDTRVPLTPEQCRTVQLELQNVSIIVQPSELRCYPDDSYKHAGIPVQEDLSGCDIIMGIKEVTPESLIPDKTYIFFSHTSKKQPHNKKLLQAIVQKGITLIDYELLTDSKGIRIIGFGRWAGLIGAYHGIRAFCMRTGLFELPLPQNFKSLDDMLKVADATNLPAIRIAVTGDGRVAGGAEEMMSAFRVRKVTVNDYLQNIRFETPVYVQLDPEKYNKRKDEVPFDLKHFFSNPQLYTSNFLRFCNTTDMLIMASYWDPRAPMLFTTDQMTGDNFRINVIADITCDMNGSIPSTVKTTTFKDPYYDYNPFTNEADPAFSGEKNITVMAIDNLPNGLPRESSSDFGFYIMKNILQLIVNDPEKILERATIAKGGRLTPLYSYLNSWLNDKQTL
jgi:alanine dehydrogenase